MHRLIILNPEVPSPPFRGSVFRAIKIRLTVRLLSCLVWGNKAGWLATVRFDSTEIGMMGNARFFPLKDRSVSPTKKGRVPHLGADEHNRGGGARSGVI